jgi:hypothetical protein
MVVGFEPLGGIKAMPGHYGHGKKKKPLPPSAGGKKKKPSKKKKR